MPGQPLYPVMRVAERAQLALTRSPQAEARLRLTLVDRRVREITFLARAGRTQDVDRLQQEVGREIEMAQASLGLPAGVAVAATPAG